MNKIDDATLVEGTKDLKILRFCGTPLKNYIEFAGIQCNKEGACRTNAGFILTLNATAPKLFFL